MADHIPLTQSLQSAIPVTAQPPINVVQPLITLAHTAPLPSPMPAATGAIMPPVYHYTPQAPIHQMASDTLPPMLAQMCQKIIQGEFTDFFVLLYKAAFPDAAADPLPSARQPIKKISSFVMWMQAWNLYLSVILSHNPTKVLEMIPYQSVSMTTSILTHSPLHTAQ